MLKSTMGASDSLNCINMRHCEIFPYLMLQPLIRCDNVTKTIVLNGRAQYFSQTDSTSGLAGQTKRPPVPREELFGFAEMVVRKLKTRCPEFVSDGLVRVDIFQTTEGKLVVNEVESFDANFTSCRGEEEALTQCFLTKYFEKILSDGLHL